MTMLASGSEPMRLTPGPKQDLGMFTPGEYEFHSVTGWTVGEARLEARM